MANRKFDKEATSAIMKTLGEFAKEHGVLLVRHAATKWANGQREKARLLQQRAELEKELADVSKRLSR